jgi:hypothetical protein
MKVQPHILTTGTMAALRPGDTVLIDDSLNPPLKGLFFIRSLENCRYEPEPDDQERKQAIHEEAREITRKFLDRKFKKN